VKIRSVLGSPAVRDGTGGFVSYLTLTRERVDVVLTGC
jgi:hypothetical protein